MGLGITSHPETPIDSKPFQTLTRHNPLYLATHLTPTLCLVLQLSRWSFAVTFEYHRKIGEMQAPQTSRTIQRRSPAADPGPPPNVPPRSVSPGPNSQPRASTSSVKSNQSGGSSRRPTQPVSILDANTNPLALPCPEC
jgi:hypothetical protein